jgi:hypothetical protein
MDFASGLLAERLKIPIANNNISTHTQVKTLETPTSRMDFETPSENIQSVSQMNLDADFINQIETLDNNPQLLFVDDDLAGHEQNVLAKKPVCQNNTFPSQLNELEADIAKKRACGLCQRDICICTTLSTPLDYANIYGVPTTYIDTLPKTFTKKTKSLFSVQEQVPNINHNSAQSTQNSIRGESQPQKLKYKIKPKFISTKINKLKSILIKNRKYKKTPKKSVNINLKENKILKFNSNEPIKYLPQISIPQNANPQNKINSNPMSTDDKHTMINERYKSDANNKNVPIKDADEYKRIALRN